jgi:hemerythrin
MEHKLQWQTAYMVGVKEVDQQHKQLFEMINSLQDAYESNQQKADIQKILEKMGDYLSTHFTCEEQYLKDHPRFEEHRKEHWKFVNQTMKFTHEYDSNDAVFEYSVIDFLKRWLLNHVLNTDIVFFRDLKKSASI